MTIGRLHITAYRSRVWWGWCYLRHVHSFHWGVLYLGRIGLCWSIR